MPNVKEISVDEVATQRAQLLLIDVREDSEWSAGHIPGAIHLSKGIIERDIEKIVPDKTAKIVLYCGGGYRSALAADSLQKMGYADVRSMAGGWRAWCEKGSGAGDAPTFLSRLNKKRRALVPPGGHIGWHHAVACWLAIFFAVFFAARLISAWDMSETAAMQGPWLWLRGIISDLSIAALVAVCAVGLAVIARWLPYALLFVICLLLAGNREYISEWQSNISFMDAAVMLAPDFVRGSVLTLQLGITAVLLLAVGAAKAWLMRRAVMRFAPPARLFWGACGVLVLLMLLPATPPQMWVQQNIFEENLRQNVQALLPKGSIRSEKAKIAAERLLQRQNAQDLKGQPFITPQPGANVLFITIESMSGTTVERGWMPYLQNLGNNNMYFRQYILPNITTARGLYSLHCGEQTLFGRYGRDRMAQHIQDKHILCLPKILAGEGYRTIYVQGADLDFQDKGHIMPNMGFKTVYGNERFKSDNWFSTWGPDDISLYKEIEKIIEETERESSAPWMISTMTVGTHHPYNVDPSFDPTLPLKERAFRYADKAIEQLVAWLESTGRLDNTLVVISGDESRETRKASSRQGSVLTRNHGLLVVLTPRRDKLVSQDIYLQNDVPISVLDYLGIKPPPSVPGRSLFRRYDDFRTIAFADYGQNALYMLWRPKQMIACSTNKWDCRRYGLGDKSLFDPEQDFSKFRRTTSDGARALMELNAKRWKDK